ncbi:MAG TPA: hypothetical protein VMZ25_11000, partial [Terriglobales bacterium]|nr:hypothetical protein [Terriglobales bacterium]
HPTFCFNRAEEDKNVPAKQVSYNGWSNCWRIDGGGVEVVVLADAGPRILHLALQGAENELYEVPADAGRTGGPDFRMYGGHRLWVAPEVASTAYPDNSAVEVDLLPEGARFTPPVEATGLQKQVTVAVRANARIKVVHRITNHSERVIDAAPWALTVMRPGGRVVLPLPPRAPHGPEHLLPKASLALWSYTDLVADCWRVGPKYLELDQRRADAGFGMQKAGLRNPAGWGAYLRGSHVFIKAVHWREAAYPDFGSNFETFANKDFIELETLGPQTELAPGAMVEHVEYWGLWKDIDEPLSADAIDRTVVPKAQELLRELDLATETN